MTRRWTMAVGFAIAVCVAVPARGWGDDAEPVNETPIGEMPVVLPSELDTDPADLPPGETVGGAAETAASEIPGLPEGEGDPESSDDGVSEEEFLANPFPHLESDMQSAVVDLKDGRTRPPTEVTQPRILSRLDLMIAELEKSSMGAGNGGGPNPANASTLKPGPGGRGEMRAPNNDGRDWADLTPKERDKILQSRTDGFPAGFDAVLADYFRRVARGQEAAASSAVTDEATDAPATGE